MIKTLEVTPEEFIRANRGLVKLLRVINKASGDKKDISTRRLLQEVGANEESKIYRAEKQGYIMREELIRPDKKGAHPIVNIITPKGRKLLEELGFVRSRRRRGKKEEKGENT